MDDITTSNMENTDLDLFVGIAIKRLRVHNKLTQSALAERAGVSQGCISQIESGQRNRGVLNLKVLQRIAKALGNRRLSEIIQLAEGAYSVQTLRHQANAVFSLHQDHSS